MREVDPFNFQQPCFGSQKANLLKKPIRYAILSWFAINNLLNGLVVDNEDARAT